MSSTIVEEFCKSTPNKLPVADSSVLASFSDRVINNMRKIGIFENNREMEKLINETELDLQRLNKLQARTRYTNQCTKQQQEKKRITAINQVERQLDKMKATAIGVSFVEMLKKARSRTEPSLKHTSCYLTPFCDTQLLPSNLVTASNSGRRNLKQKKTMQAPLNFRKRPFSASISLQVLKSSGSIKNSGVRVSK